MRGGEAMEVEKGVRKSITLPTLSHASETPSRSPPQHWGTYAKEMTCMRGTCGVSGWEGETEGYKRSTRGV